MTFLSPTHILLLLVVVLLLFGAKRLPEFGRSLGSGMREFKHSLDHDAGTGPRLTSLSGAESDTQPRAAPETGTKPDA